MLHQTMVYASSIHEPRPSLAEMIVFSHSVPSTFNIHQNPNLPELQTYLTPQHDIVLYPLPS
jgi:hypothetical protein